MLRFILLFCFSSTISLAAPPTPPPSLPPPAGPNAAPNVHPPGMSPTMRPVKGAPPKPMMMKRPTVFKVTYEVTDPKKQGGSVTIEEGKPGGVKSMTVGQGGTSLEVTVRQGAADKLIVNYRFQIARGER